MQPGDQLNEFTTDWGEGRQKVTLKVGDLITANFWIGYHRVVGITYRTKYEAMIDFQYVCNDDGEGFYNPATGFENPIRSQESIYCFPVDEARVRRMFAMETERAREKCNRLLEILRNK